MNYELLDSGKGRKLERFGPYILARPCGQAVWQPSDPAAWSRAVASFSREGGMRWQGKTRLPERWEIEIDGVKFYLSGTDFGHLGVFPEQRASWQWVGDTVRAAVQKRGQASVLNLFAYSGGSTLAAARAGATVCHLDAAKGMVDWARENATLNRLGEVPVRWIVDDVRKFIKRELRRGRRYDGIILDPPSFGRGKQAEVFKIDDDLPPLLDDLAGLLSADPAFVLLSCHTPSYTPRVLSNLLSQGFGSGHLDNGEMLLEGPAGVLPVPSGTYARWTP